MGEAGKTRAAIASADVALDQQRGGDELHGEVAGQFGWGRSRHDACIATALVQLGDGDAAAERVRRALSALAADSDGGLQLERACCDLANAELVRDAPDLDAATDALAAVWPLPESRRIESVTGRLAHTGRLLSSHRWRGSLPAVELRDRITTFTAEASLRALPPGRNAEPASDRPRPSAGTLP
jgi:hypothetical protein